MKRTFAGLALGFWLLTACTLSPSPATPAVATGQPTASSATPTGDPAQPTPAATDAAFTPTPAEPFPGEGPWPVTFSTADGITLSGTMFGKGTTGIVLAPMYLGDQQAWHAFAEKVAAQGYRVLAFDFRGYGGSQGERSVARAADDLTAAVAFLRQQNVNPVLLIGAGLGGNAAIKVAALDSAIAGVAVISAPRAFEGLEISDTELAALTMPTLWLGTRLDLTQNVEEMYDLAASANKTLWIYEGSGLQGTFIFEGADGQDLERRLMEFMAQVAAS